MQDICFSALYIRQVLTLYETVKCVHVAHIKALHMCDV